MVGRQSLVEGDHESQGGQAEIVREGGRGEGEIYGNWAIW